MSRRPLPESFWHEVTDAYEGAEGSVLAAVAEVVARWRQRPCSQKSAINVVHTARQRGYLMPTRAGVATSGHQLAPMRSLADAIGIDVDVLSCMCDEAGVQVRMRSGRPRRTETANH